MHVKKKKKSIIFNSRNVARSCKENGINVCYKSSKIKKVCYKQVMPFSTIVKKRVVLINHTIALESSSSISLFSGTITQEGHSFYYA